MVKRWTWMTGPGAISGRRVRQLNYFRDLDLYSASSSNVTLPYDGRLPFSILATQPCEELDQVAGSSNLAPRHPASLVCSFLALAPCYTDASHGSHRPRQRPAL
jgi:hypothetical protein